MKRRSAGAKRENDLTKAIRFTAFFGVLFALAFAVLQYTPLAKGLGFAAAVSSQSVLSLAGVQTQIAMLENGNYALEGKDFIAELNEACAALVEIAVLFAIVFASFEKSVRERAKGFVAGAALLLVLNPIRIAASVIFIDPLVHDILFRITLIITIIGFYAFWHYGPLARRKSFWLGMHRKIRLK
ncbi:exosortase/archaeosortase family protein [Candidatus Micrarchaeota archaeon]|nr:exosortase/archaeosortase family protein [Candidatus Micrarchaeota archaeon]